MKCMRFLLFFIFAFLSLACFAEKGDMWEVTDADLTVWDSPNYLNKLGMMHQGDTFEEEGMDAIACSTSKVEQSNPVCQP